MKRLIIEARDYQSELNRLFKLYGEKFDKAVNFYNYLNCKSQYGMREAFQRYVRSVIMNLGFADGELPPYVEFVVRMMSRREGEKYLYESRRNGNGAFLRMSLDHFEKCKASGALKRAGMSTNMFDYSLNEILSLRKKIAGSSLIEKMKSLGGAIETVYNNGRVGIYAVKTWEANRLLGSNTAWCTVANYNNNEGYGGMYYIICHLTMDGSPLLDERRVQFHFEWSDRRPCYELYAMDVYDDEVDMERIAEEFGDDVADEVESLEEHYHKVVVEDGLDDRRNDQYAFNYYDKKFISMFGIGMLEFMSRCYGADVTFERAHRDKEGCGVDFDFMVQGDGEKTIFMFDEETDGVYLYFCDLNIDDGIFKRRFNGDVDFLIEKVRGYIEEDAVRKGM